MSPTVSTPELSITLVVWNALPRLEDCLESISEDVIAGFAEVIAADNASPDRSVDAVEAAFPEATVIRMESNLGFAGGVNRTWPHIRGRYWMLLNPDTLVPPGGLRELVAWMDSHPDVAIASPALADAEGGDVRATAHALPSAALVIAELLRLHKLLPRDIRGRVFQGPYWTGGDNLGGGWVPGTAMIVRREAAEQVGLPDEHFFLYGEDIDWCWRMRRAGWRVGYCSQVVVRHAESDTNLREYGSSDTLLRIARTELEAVRRARGTLRARLYGGALVVALGVESIHPRRTRDAREHTRALFRAWRTALRGA
jgi:N-acetylglucosaminyl-diphospho-decaprenol L-rhamnosyltransferase